MAKCERGSFTKKNSAALAEQHGDVCANCGTSVGIEWHHIVPLSLGGKNTISNYVPLCHACHCAAHHGRHISRYRSGVERSGRHPNVSNRAAFKALDMLAAGKIGIRGCKQLMKLSGRTEPRQTAQYKRWCAARGIVDVRNILDTRITNGNAMVASGDVIGEVEYADGTKKDILFNDVGANDMIKYVVRGRTAEGERTFWEIKISALVS